MLDLQKPPGLAETIDWARALTALGEQELDVESIQATLGAVLKYHEDLLSIRDDVLAGLVVTARPAEPLAEKAGPEPTPSSGTSSCSAACSREGGLEIGPRRIADALRRARLHRARPPRGRLLDASANARLAARGARDVRSCVRCLVPCARAAQPSLAPGGPAAARRGSGGEVAAGLGLGARARRRRGLEMRRVGAATESCCARSDFAAMSPEEFARARVLIRRDRGGAGPSRRTHRLRADRPERRCARRPARSCAPSLATGGDPVMRAYQQPGTHGPRKLVLLLDVSGSMEAYSRALLLYLHAVRGLGALCVETFAFGTWLSRLTPELGVRDPGVGAHGGGQTCRRLVRWHPNR